MFNSMMKRSILSRAATSSNPRRVFGVASNQAQVASEPISRVTHLTSEQFAALNPVDRVRAIYEIHGSQAIQLASMQRTSGVLMHLIHRAQVPLPILFIDTGYLHQETVDLRDEFVNRYNLNVHTVSPETSVEEQDATMGKDLYSTHEGQVKCCKIRKEKPLERAIANLNVTAKMSGMMQSQGGARKDVQPVMEEPGTGIHLYNPLFDWDNKMIHEYNKEHNVPVHELYNHSYKSIGCKPCTTPVKAGEDARAGRWRHLRAANDNTHIYCGLNKTDVSPEAALRKKLAVEKRAAAAASGKKTVKISYLSKKKKTVEASA